MFIVTTVSRFVVLPQPSAAACYSPALGRHRPLRASRAALGGGDRPDS
jgi:hypothetical protein